MAQKKKDEIEILRRKIEMYEDLTKQRKNELAEKEEEIQSLKAQNKDNEYLKKQNELLVKKTNEIFNENVNLDKENKELKKLYEDLTKQRKDELAENNRKIADLNQQIKNGQERMQNDIRYLENKYRVDKEKIERKYEDEIEKLSSKKNNCKCQNDILKRSDAAEKFSTGSDDNLNSSIELTSIVEETTTSSIQMVEKGDGTFEYSEKQTSVKAEQHIHHVQQPFRLAFLQERIFATPAIVINPEPQHSSQAAPDVIITSEPKPTTSRDLSSAGQSQGSSQAAANVISVPESKQRQRTSVKKKRVSKSKPRKSYSKSSIKSKEESHCRKKINNLKKINKQKK